MEASLSPLSVYCDGSGTAAADSPACIGVVVFQDGQSICECSAFVGIGTNNVAELWAVRRALYLIRWVGWAKEETPAVIYTDSQYAISMSTGLYSPRSNVELVEAIVGKVRQHTNLTFQHVPGHAGVFGNEIADWLAGQARARVLASRGNKVRVRNRPRGQL